LQSRHGVAGDPSDEVFEHPDCSAAFIARLVPIRCRELADLLAAYRTALRRSSITRDDIVQRILSHLNLPAAPTPMGPGGSPGWDLGDESTDDWVLGMDPVPPDVHVTQCGPPWDACVDPPAPDC
jgi:hypothetical protein